MLSSIEEAVLEILNEEPDRRVAAAKIAQGLVLGLQNSQATVNETLSHAVQLNEIATKFFHFEGRANAVLEVIKLLDHGLNRQALRVALAEEAQKNLNEALHYQVLMKAMG